MLRNKTIRLPSFHHRNLFHSMFSVLVNVPTFLTLCNNATLKAISSAQHLRTMSAGRALVLSMNVEEIPGNGCGDNDPTVPPYFWN